MAPTASSDGKLLTVNLSSDLHQRLKVGSALLDTNMGALMSVLIDEYMPHIVDGQAAWKAKRREELVKGLKES